MRCIENGFRGRDGTDSKRVKPLSGIHFRMRRGWSFRHRRAAMRFGGRPIPWTARICRRHALAAAVIAIAWSLAGELAQAAYPERLITLIVPFPAGGPTDIIARIVSVGLQRSRSEEHTSELQSRPH